MTSDPIEKYAATYKRRNLNDQSPFGKKSTCHVIKEIKINNRMRYHIQLFKLEMVLFFKATLNVHIYGGKNTQSCILMKRL